MKDKLKRSLANKYAQQLAREVVAKGGTVVDATEIMEIISNAGQRALVGCVEDSLKDMAKEINMEIVKFGDDTDDRT